MSKRPDVSEGEVSMPTPALLLLKEITCLQTEDLTGSDELFGNLGNLKFNIGRFSDNETRTLNLQKNIPSGVTTLSIFESDLFDPDDLLGSIDLTVDMDTDRIVGLLEGRRGRYDITLFVTSQSD